MYSPKRMPKPSLEGGTVDGGEGTFRQWYSLENHKREVVHRARPAHQH